MIKVPLRNFSLNKFGFWFDAKCEHLEQKAYEIGRNYTAVSLFSRSKYLKSERLLRYLAKYLDRQTLTPAPERLKVSDNSLLLFYSKNVGTYLPQIRFLLELVSPILVLFFTQWNHAGVAYAVFMWFHQPFVGSYARSAVVRMDLLPQLEAVSIQKVGAFGLPRTEIVSLKNLVKTKPEHSKYDYYYRFLGGFDPEMLFKDGETNEEIAFELNGKWIEENLKHPLIN